ncbi:hypothetical protein B0E45_04515 [Sinorhizobium sp. A49]|nr:hypothetical protein B0E45_04515 [Sinorhizobium sp. A49]
MPAPFVELAETCAPAMPSELLAAIASLESGMAPLSIRINSDYPPGARPGNVREATQAATALIAKGQSVDLGLGGISPFDLATMGMSIADAFDPCQNLKATARLLSQYRAAAIRAGHEGDMLDTVMLRSYFGRGDASAGEMVGYDRLVQKEKERLKRHLAELSLNDASEQDLSSYEPRERDSTAASPREDFPFDRDAEAQPPREWPIAAAGQAWDVFASKGASSVLVFGRKNGSLK